MPILQVDDEIHFNNINDAMSYIRKIPNDVTIISGDDVEIQSNKYMLSVFSPTLRHLLSTSSYFFLPECSTFSLKCLLNMIANGFAVTAPQKLSNANINEVIETAQLLSIEMRHFYHDETVPSFVKPAADDVSEKTNDQSPDSVIDVMDTVSVSPVFDSVRRSLRTHVPGKSEHEIVERQVRKVKEEIEENDIGSVKKRQKTGNSIPRADESSTMDLSIHVPKMMKWYASADAEGKVLVSQITKNKWFKRTDGENNVNQLQKTLDMFKHHGIIMEDVIGGKRYIQFLSKGHSEAKQNKISKIKQKHPTFDPYKFKTVETMS